MKNFTNKWYIIGIILLVFSVSVTSASDEDFTKKYKKEYEVRKDTKLQIENKYGNIDIKNWDKNLISIEVTITVRTSNEEKAARLFDQIDIEFAESENIISAKTSFDSDLGRLFQSSGDKAVDIYYSVNMPKTVPLDLINKYGNVFINELTSTSNINVKYGNLKANRIIHSDEKPLTQITMGYSNAKIQQCAWVKFDIKYSNVEMDASKALIFLSRYSKVFITKGSSLVIESKYDTYRLGRFTNMVATAGYSNFKAEEISNKIIMETKYTDLNVDFVPAGFERVKVDAGYGNYNIIIDPEASYKLDGYAKYARISYPDNSRVNRFNENNELRVEGLVGTDQNTGSAVTINSNYCSVKLVK
ncbi:MAG: hypothetical protein JW723_08790 [Bacteroidales bacterium]|nr:hypothetical protein [Bacteroidales bacterium]